MPARGTDLKYVKMADAVAAQIEAGTFRPGDRIPSLRRLRDQFDVSLTTALEACRLLEDRGLVHSRPRSGHFVAERAGTTRRAPEASTPSSRARRVNAPLSVKLNLGIGAPNEVTLGAAVQGPELMPMTALNRLLSQALRLQPTACHSYDAPPGNPLLRRAIARRGSDAGYAASPDEIVITSGAKEAVYLSVRAVTRPGDTVAIESPAYYALLEVLASLDLRAVEISTHPADGMNLDHLERVLKKQRIAAIALTSTFSNPTGACMSDAAKQRLVDLVETHQVPLIEDDVYGELAFDGRRPKSVKAFDRSGLVLYCGSYSKTLSPGLRIGWAVPGRFQGELEHLKLVVNQFTATAPQLAVAAFLDSGGFDRHLRRVRSRYRDQMTSTIDAVVEHFPDSTRHTTPNGGHVLWIQLPDRLDAMWLYEVASAQGVRVAPGPMFSPSGGYQDFIRLNTGFPWSPMLQRQVATLGELVSLADAPRVV